MNLTVPVKLSSFNQTKTKKDVLDKGQINTILKLTETVEEFSLLFKNGKFTTRDQCDEYFSEREFIKNFKSLFPKACSLLDI